MSRRTPFILVATLAFPFHVIAETSAVVISEVQIGGESINDEFVELLNRSDAAVNLSGWKIQKRTSSGSASSVKSLKGECATLPSGAHYLWANSKGIYAASADATTTASLAKNNTFELLDADGTLVDSLAWGEDSSAGMSLSRDPDTLLWNGSGIPTPTSKEAVCPTEEAPELTVQPSESATVRINELLPNPKGDENAGEWIELFNFGGTAVPLAGWMIHDTSKTGGYVFGKDASIDTNGFLTIPRSISKLSLNNANETVSLLDPTGTIIDTASYEKTAEGASYGFSINGWRWSRTPTPGAENIFGKAPDAKKTAIPKIAYKNIPTAFSAHGNKKNMKYVWDFGDGHKSYKSKTTHAYEKSGAYHGTLTVNDGTESDVTYFTTTVKKYSAPKVRIVELAPNPKGKDFENEWLLIENRSKKPFDLLGWSIATGSKKKTIANHPVRDSFIIAAGESLRLTRAFSLFTLPNKRGVVELRAPDGKTAQAFSYRRDDGIKENETYRKKAGSSWEWTGTEETRNKRWETNEEKTSKNEETRREDDAPIMLLQSSNESELSFNEFISLGTAVSPTFPETMPHVLGVSDERTPPTEQTVVFSIPEFFIEKINDLANQTILELKGM